MTDDLLFSLRVIVASMSRNDHDLFRRAAAAATVPIELIEADGIAAASRSIAGGSDLAFFDMAFGNEAIAKIAAAARATRKPPFTVQLSPPGIDAPFQTDALASKPNDPEEATRLLTRAICVRRTSRVLVVDDSSTMRGIVCKILAATRFPLDVTEAELGGEAIELARTSDFGIVFIDQNLPGLDGLETINEIRRAQRHPTFVLMTSMQDEAVVASAREHGAAFLRKPFFPADIDALLCNFYGLRALNPNRA